MKMKRKTMSKIYTMTIIIMMIVIMATTAMAFVPKSFSYVGDYPCQSYRTTSMKKTDSSDVYVKYSSGTPTYIDVEVWASDGTSGDAQNLTLVHTEGSNNRANYYKVTKGNIKLLGNTVYNVYGSNGYTTLRIYTGGTGTVSGEWSATTNN